MSIELCSGTNTEFYVPDHGSQAAIMAKFRAFMLSSTVIGVELHRLGLKFNFGQVEVQRGEAELNFNLTKIELEWSCTR